MWVIRGGERDQLTDPFVDHGVVALGFGSVPDAEILTRTEMRRFIVEGGSKDPDHDAATVSAFVNEMQPGESILLLDPARGEVVIGEVAGRYEFDPAAPPAEHPHRRPITWLVRHAIADLPGPVQKIHQQKHVLVQDRAAEWSGHMARVRAGELGRDPADRRAVEVSASKARAPRVSRAPRAPKAPPAPKAAAIPKRTCPSCFLQHHPDFFVGEYCRDCAE